jgi:hypothetical protein
LRKLTQIFTRNHEHTPTNLSLFVEAAGP